jgi:dienelactone hydrolase
VNLEIYFIETLTLSDKQFLVGDRDGLPVRIAAHLHSPAADTRVPAVVLLHGSGGIGGNVPVWVQALNGMGVAVLIVDSFSGRGITETITDQTLLSSFSMILDAYRGLEFLAQHPQIDPARIAVLGFSKGGFAALYSSMRRFQGMWSMPGLEFSAYLAFYTRCDAALLDDENVSDHPIRLFHGAADDYVPVAPTRAYVERLRRAGKNVQLTVYEGARHVFDNPRNAEIVSLPNAAVSSNCRRAEIEPGSIINLDTGNPFSWNDSCITRGATVGHNQRAREKATTSVQQFFQSLWQREM